MESFFEYDQNVYDVITKNKELVRKKEMIDKILKSPQIKKLLQKASNGKFDLDEDNKNFSKMLVDSNYDINTILDKYMNDMYKLAPEQRNIEATEIEGATEPRSTALPLGPPLTLGRPLPTSPPPPPTGTPLDTSSPPLADLSPSSPPFAGPPPPSTLQTRQNIELPGLRTPEIGTSEDVQDGINIIGKNLG